MFHALFVCGHYFVQYGFIEVCIFYRCFWESSFLGGFLRFFALYRRNGFNVILLNFITFALHNNQCLHKYQVHCVFFSHLF